MTEPEEGCVYTVKVTQAKPSQREGQEWVLLADTGGKDGGHLYGYAPRTIRETQEVEIYKQTVDSLQLISVIKAVNGIAKKEERHAG